MNLKKTDFLKIRIEKPQVEMTVPDDHTTYIRTTTKLKPSPDRITERLQYWAHHAPDRVFLAERNSAGKWKQITYAETWQRVNQLSQFLLGCSISPDKPLAIISGNSISHGLIALAALHIGIPYAPISPNYALRSTNYEKLRHCISLLNPGLIYINDYNDFAKAIQHTAPGVELLTEKNTPAGSHHYAEALQFKPTSAVDEAFRKVDRGAVAKILFTSGSTGQPKGVINTHGNITTNWQQITQIFPFFADGGLRLIDWLPWHHTFGGNHNFGLVLYNGGSLYIDDGNPTPEGIKTTVHNLGEIAPTVYFNVPRGFEELIPYLKSDTKLREKFFSRLKLFFYAGASMAPHVWDGLEMLAYETTGKRLMISTGLGMTEASPSACFNIDYGSRSGRLGVPLPGITMKLARKGEKWEARFKGGNITPGYWRNDEATKKAFDTEGFYCTGDAVRMVNKQDPGAGIVFDGRIAEDFKLDTGTWVNAGILAAKLIRMSGGLIQYAVITGQDRAFVGAIIFPDLNHCMKILNQGPGSVGPEIFQAPEIRNLLYQSLQQMATSSTGSSTYIKRVVIADFTPSPDRGELTDKGNINSKAILTNHAELVNRIYEDLPVNVLDIQLENHA